ncbi:hypothetical protein CLOBY_18250 [Clostridium saccharobutylicum]|uniref:YmfQ family protein n=1 Tax=Clostridium saccharobutylicum TaxID=169679 RepID=UPI000983CE3C|nr:YmfQ family protein [Clostridium saccharobutylicum]AQS09694.1 hypothetical protein CLOBY_18250 [Clostridium saccharobutylicum]MBC2436912.1 YmfQ family protein [Clostridium saccharobutylicum]NSB89260.1 uncharacterized protein YmfQ (DUF2313 family) [Clostridium saccharobutylicum]NYC27914.1 uncharacterized protein YmfQ (DUF2313 family) [Clostridium saccharobutylicum]OOM17111.1 hypothetical protein CLSAB_20590 [Clostridium saccharobutylicum]
MNYGTTEYGLELYGLSESQNEDDIKAISPNLMKYMPDYYITSNVMKQIENANSLEIGRFNCKIDDMQKQLSIDTATWGLIYWENEYGIETNLTMSYEDRRNVLNAKRKGQGTTTKEMIKNVAETFSGGEVDIIEDNSNYAFIVKFIGIKGIPKNMQLFKNMLEDIKPAHLAYSFEYSYNVWNLIEGNKLTWDNSKEKTWDKLKTY